VINSESSFVNGTDGTITSLISAGLGYSQYPPL